MEGWEEGGDIHVRYYFFIDVSLLSTLFRPHAPGS